MWSIASGNSILFSLSGFVSFIEAKAFFLKFVFTDGGQTIVRSILSLNSILKDSKKPVIANFDAVYAVL